MHSQTEQQLLIELWLAEANDDMDLVAALLKELQEYRDNKN